MKRGIVESPVHGRVSQNSVSSPFTAEKIMDG
jgi:hypothetical protein